VPQRTPRCQLGASSTPETRGISPHPSDHNTPTPTHETEHPYDYSADHGRGGSLLVNAASQWLHATTGRIAGDPHSWMTAVHWITGLAAKGLYTPTQAHGPKWGPTTLVIAQELSALKVCRPGIAYLMRKLKVSERTIQYHLTMLRETGLLVYRSKGTRARGVANQATVYERTIPAAFDEEHGIRTVGEGVQRRPVGAAPEARTLLGKLAKKAARKTRRRPPRTPVSGRGRCTPMEGGSTGTSSADRTYSPPESKLASGNGESSARKSVKRGPRKLNKIGRRYQLAAGAHRHHPVAAQRQPGPHRLDHPPCRRRRMDRPRGPGRRRVPPTSAARRVPPVRAAGLPAVLLPPAVHHQGPPPRAGGELAGLPPRRAGPPRRVRPRRARHGPAEPGRTPRHGRSLRRHPPPPGTRRRARCSTTAR
jgi:DNA-binding transcriptional ArsR family regulator